MKSEIFNLIILDESGSMSCVRKHTISGCNETINTILTAQEKYGDTQSHYVSIFAFQSGGHRPSRYIIKNVPVETVAHITDKDYEPEGCTPLYDAIGSTLTDLKTATKNKEMAIGSVTIITDGMENASKQYTCEKVANMIDALKGLGWSFNFIGANIDVKATAATLNIDNSLEFTQDEDGTQAMFARERRSRMGWLSRHNSIMSGCEAKNQNLSMRLREAAEDYFDDDRGEV